MLLAANDAAGPIEREAVTFDSLRGAASSRAAFMSGCVRLFRSYLGLGLVLVLALPRQRRYLACVVVGYRAAEDVVSSLAGPRSLRSPPWC